MIRVLSLGAGVQSSMLLFATERGEFPPVDCAIFADTQGESKDTYAWLKWITPQVSFPIYRVTNGDLWRSASEPRRTRDGKRTYLQTGIPVYLEEGLRRGRGKRQCTRTFKIEPIERKCRELLRLKRVTKRHYADGPLIHMVIGISADEADRIKPSRQPWITTSWPLVDRGITRDDCVAWMLGHGYPEPPRSACTYCPFRNAESWAALDEEELMDVARKERQIQRAYAASSEMRGVPYLHASRRPILEALADGGVTGIDTLNKFRNECEGMCGV